MPVTIRMLIVKLLVVRPSGLDAQPGCGGVFAFRLVHIFCTKYLWLMSVRSLRPPSLPVAQGIADAVFLELAVERRLADSKQLRGLQFVAVQSSNGSHDRLAFHFSECGHSCTALAMSGFDSNRRDASCLKTLLL